MCELANFISAQENITLHMVLYGRDPSIFFPLHSAIQSVSYTHLRAHETPEHLVCRLLLEKKKKRKNH